MTKQKTTTAVRPTAIRNGTYTVTAWKKDQWVVESNYWLQEYNEAGENWIDSIGFDPSSSIEYALNQLSEWQRAFPNRICRLITRADTVIALG